MAEVWWKVRIALVVSAGLTMAGCGILSPSGPEDPGLELARNRALWNAQGLDVYRFTQSRSCECPAAFLGAVTITVSGGVITAMTKVSSGDPVPEEKWPALDTVDGLFELVEQALALGPVHLAVEYHPVWGYPTRIDLDQMEDHLDDEMVVLSWTLEPVTMTGG